MPAPGLPLAVGVEDWKFDINLKLNLKLLGDDSDSGNLLIYAPGPRMLYWLRRD